MTAPYIVCVPLQFAAHAYYGPMPHAEALRLAKASGGTVHAVHLTRRGWDTLSGRLNARGDERECPRCWGGPAPVVGVCGACASEVEE